MNNFLYLVTRLPGAPPVRAGRTWPLGASEAYLTPAQAWTIAQDPGYRIGGMDLELAADPPAPSPAPAAKSRKRTP
ncbi:hypothetical protein [Candidatus Thiodictyon syntrophicum]|jgi:hypothetical protein|uniref:hypothetical protein n=1 Tax=Candidatus Thiodictyon syntrophicum TaxID=1166950 RepID=UPI0012FD4933|nr:hypothetical protein [Candidatus Thiodictyon syntrophicum]